MNTRHELAGGGPIPANCGLGSAHAGFACAGLELTANHGENGIVNHLGFLSRVFLLTNFYFWRIVAFRYYCICTPSASSLLAFCFLETAFSTNSFIRSIYETHPHSAHLGATQCKQVIWNQHLQKCIKTNDFKSL